MAQKKFYRSTEDKKVAGLIGGLAEFLDVDVNFLRFITLVMIVLSGIFPGLIAYLIAAAFVPVKPDKEQNNA